MSAVAKHVFDRMETKLLDVKVEQDAGTFSGYGAVFGNVDSYGDVIAKGAFSNTLKEWEKRGKYPPMLLQHGGWGVTSDDMLPVGAWESMVEDSKGLKVKGRLFALGTERGQYIYEGLKAGSLDGLSIGYEAKGVTYGTKPEEPARTLKEIILWECSIVTFPANDKSRVSSVKAAGTIREIENMLHDGGLSKALAREFAPLIASSPKFRDVSSGGMPEHRWDAGDDVDAELKAIAELSEGLIGELRFATLSR